MKRLILASGSPRRREVLRAAGFDFDVVASDADETYDSSQSPVANAERIARLKAETVSRRLPPTSDAVVLAADTLVVVGDEVLGKPALADDARAMLEKLSGKVHEVITGVALANSGGTRSAAAHELTRVWFRPLGADEIAAYIATGEPFDKAGAYAIQGRASRFVTRIEGCYFNVMGLPVALVDRLLKEWEEK